MGLEFSTGVGSWGFVKAAWRLSIKPDTGPEAYMLGGSWVVVSGVIIPAIVYLLITLLRAEGPWV